MGLARGYGRQTGLAPSGAVGKHDVITSWFATDAWLGKNAEVAHRVANAMKQTAIWANSHRKQSAEILARNSKRAPETLTTMVRSTYGETALAPALVQPAIDVAAKYGTLQTLPANDPIWH